MEKFVDMLDKTRITKLNERRATFVLTEIRDNDQVDKEIRCDARKVLSILKIGKDFGTLTKFGLVSLFASLKIGLALKNRLQFICRMPPMHESVFPMAQKRQLWLP